MALILLIIAVQGGGFGGFEKEHYIKNRKMIKAWDYLSRDV